MRTTARGLGTTVTGTVGVVVRAVEVGLDREEAHTLVSQIDSHWLHTTGSLRETAVELIDEAARSTSYVLTVTTTVSRCVALRP